MKILVYLRREDISRETLKNLAQLPQSAENCHLAKLGLNVAFFDHYFFVVVAKM